MLEEFADVFQVESRVRSMEEYGEGHINRTALIRMEDGAEYLLQSINTFIFKDPQALMENIYNVTAHLHGKIAARGGEPLRETLRIIPTRAGKLFYRDPQGGCWRAYPFIPGTKTYQSFENVDLCRCCGEAFGGFLADLDDFPAQTLHEVIPDFHHTPRRYEALQKALQADKMNRAGYAKELIRFAEARAGLYGRITNMLNGGALPIRVTHNDTKINNVLMDARTGRGICVIDLDTVMPGSSLYDFGDAIRFGAATKPEDTREPEKMAVNPELFAAFTRGYLSGAGEVLTEREIDLLPVGALMMTLENGLRFLTDYLEGDPYFKIHRPGQNLDRCRAQFALAADMERKMDELNAAVRAAQ